jgi:DNA-binding MarR family transcriptional regulator
LPELPERSRPRRQWPGTGNFGTLLRDPAFAAMELVNERMIERGFTDFRPAHGTIGQHLRDEGSRITELAELTQLTKPTVTYLVNDLEQLGYVERVADPADRRAKLVRPTARGRRAQQAGREIVTEIEQDWSHALGERDFQTLRGLLRRLHDVLWAPGGGDQAATGRRTAGGPS